MLRVIRGGSRTYAIPTTKCHNVGNLESVSRRRTTLQKKSLPVGSQGLRPLPLHASGKDHVIEAAYGREFVGFKGDLSHFNFVCRLTRGMAKD